MTTNGCEYSFKDIKKISQDGAALMFCNPCVVLPVQSLLIRNASRILKMKTGFNFKTERLKSDWTKLYTAVCLNLFINAHVLLESIFLIYK